MVDLRRLERTLARRGCERIAGVDEAGRGSLAGPLVAAAVILPEGFETNGIDDSKAFARKRRRRRAAYERIVETAAYSICSVQPEVIDREGLHACNIELLRRAAQGLDPLPDFILFDGVVLPL